MKLYNTLTKQKEEFRPAVEGKIGIYVCGITAYDNCHIGHARSALVFDMITRYFAWRGFEVRYVKNFTDVDDKIIGKANTEGLDIHEIAARYIAEHNHDMASLGVKAPWKTPLATEHIPEMISLIQKLIAENIAYVAGGDVYYSVEKFADYGKLSGRNTEEMLAGARVEIGEQKRNPLDFTLWKASKENEPWWESPWGRGRPGWHIECSAMGQYLLGDNFDIHGGGADLIFPHHENEIAQSQAAFGKIPANYWLHNGFIRVHGDKMSKSLNNFITIKEIVKLYHPEILRFFMLQFHYRSPVDFSYDALSEARTALVKCYRLLESMNNELAGDKSREKAGESNHAQNEALQNTINYLPARFTDAMDDDFNSAKGFGVIFDFVRALNGALADKKFLKSSDAHALLLQARRNFVDVGNALGLFACKPEEFFEEDSAKRAKELGIDRNIVEELVRQRQEARQQKEWKRADEIREKLGAMKVQIKDSSAGTAWFIE